MTILFLSDKDKCLLSVFFKGFVQKQNATLLEKFSIFDNGMYIMRVKKFKFNLFFCMKIWQNGKKPSFFIRIQVKDT